MITVTVSRSLTLTPQQWAELVATGRPDDVAGHLWQHHPRAALDAVLTSGETTDDDWHVYVHPAPEDDDDA